MRSLKHSAVAIFPLYHGDVPVDLLIPFHAHQSPFFLFFSTADAALSAKLAEEFAYEQEAATALAGQEPEWLEEFRNTGVWKIVDKSGLDEVVLERNFGNEKLVS